MKLLLLLIYLLGAYGIEVLKPGQVELLPDENLQPQMKLKPRLQLDPARPADRAKKRSEDEKIPLESGAPDRKSKK